MGARSRYSKARDAEVKQLISFGANITQIAQFFGITTTTLKKWRERNKSFDACFAVAMKDKNARVKEALYSRAVGCKHKETKVTNYKGDVQKTKIVKHYPPDVKACETWLYNRDPDNWQPRKAVDGDFDDGEAVEPVSVTIEINDASKPKS